MTRQSIDVDGDEVLSYIPYSQTPPTADAATALAGLDVVIRAVLDQLAGWWLTSESDELTDSLLDAGATVVRHGHLYRRSIAGGDAELDPLVPDVLLLRPLQASAAELAAVSKAAYRHGHPDFDPDHETETELARLLAGAAVGPFNATASWQLTHDGSCCCDCDQHQ